MEYCTELKKSKVKLIVNLSVDELIKSDLFGKVIVGVMSDEDRTVLVKKRISYISKYRRESGKDIKPYIDKDYICATCGSTSGKCDNDTSYCYHCDTDNWIHVEESRTPLTKVKK
ncbi:MAG: hypothetical protein ACRDD8_02900 [Bacteroidales bacterium]